MNINNRGKTYGCDLEKKLKDGLSGPGPGVTHTHFYGRWRFLLMFAASAYTEAGFMPIFANEQDNTKNISNLCQQFLFK